MNAQMKNNLGILMGRQSAPNKIQLSENDKKQLSDAYFALFFALAGANWGRGSQTLGAAWYQALKQIKSMIGAKDKANPVTMYLKQIFAAHSTKWAEVMMTSPKKDSPLECTPEQRSQWNSEQAKNIATAMATINKTLSLYQQKEVEIPTTNRPSPSQIQKNILMYMAAQKRIKQIS